MGDWVDIFRDHIETGYIYQANEQKGRADSSELKSMTAHEQFAEAVTADEEDTATEMTWNNLDEALAIARGFASEVGQDIDLQRQISLMRKIEEIIQPESL